MYISLKPVIANAATQTMNFAAEYACPYCQSTNYCDELEVELLTEHACSHCKGKSVICFSVGQSVVVNSGVRQGKNAIVLEVLDSGYYYVHVDTDIPGRRVKVVVKHDELQESLKHPRWVTDLNDYDPISLGSHWGNDQAGFNVSLSGRIWLTDNKDKPSHRQLISGDGEDATVYSGIFSWAKGEPTIWTYPHLESVLHNPEVKEAIKSLLGVKGITESTPVISNGSRKTLFMVGEI